MSKTNSNDGQCWSRCFRVRLGIRLLGVTLSSIDRDGPQDERQLTLAL
jgi:hypothetical protein